MIWRSRGTSWKTLMTKVIFNFQYHKGIIKLELSFFGINLLSTFCTLWKVLLLYAGVSCKEITIGLIGFIIYRNSFNFSKHFWQIYYVNALWKKDVELLFEIVCFLKNKIAIMTWHVDIITDKSILSSWKWW